jgi:hypothetical protein
VKPLPVAPGTFTDHVLAWPQVQSRWAARHGLRAAERLRSEYAAADRRDAELMRRMAILRGHPFGQDAGMLGFEHPMPSLNAVERYFPHWPPPGVDNSYFA